MNSNKTSYKYAVYFVAMIVLAGLVLADPGVSSVGVNDNLLTEADVGEDNFIVTIDFNVTMNTSVDATVAFDPPLLTTLTNCGGVWSDGDTFVYTCDIVDDNVEVSDVDIQISDAEDNESVAMAANTTSAVFSVDTVKPTVVSVTPAYILIAEDDVGEDAFWVTVVFSEAMNTSTDATITFNPAIGTTLTNCAGIWTNTSTFNYTCDVEDGNVEIDDVDVQVSNAQDAAGNTMDADTTTGQDKFSVDTVKPEIDSFGPNYVWYTEARVGLGNFMLQFTFNEEMDTGTNPSVTFISDETKSTFVNCLGSWNDDFIFNYTCDVFDSDVEVQDFDYNMSGAKDAAGNTITAISAFGGTGAGIDMVKPTVDSATAAPDPAKAGTVTVTVVFSENMSNATAPTVQVTGLDTDPHSVTMVSYFATTWVGTLNLPDADEEATATISISGGKDTRLNTMEDDETAGTFEVDTVEPVMGSVSLSPSYDNGTVLFISGTTNISASITEANIDKCQYSIDAGSNWAAGTVVGADCIANNIDTSSATAILMRANDTAGNMDASDAVAVSVDITPPDTTALCNGEACTGAWSQVDVAVNLSCEDDVGGSGCNVTYYCIDTANTCSPSTIFTAGILISDPGTSYIRYYSIDLIGNAEPVLNKTIRIDSGKPLFIFDWWDTEDFNSTTFENYETRLPDFMDFTTANDIFYSPNELVIEFSVNVTDSTSPIDKVFADLSDFDSFAQKGTCTGLLELDYNSSTGRFEGSCTLDAFDEDDLIAHSEDVVASFTVDFIANDTSSNEAYTIYNLSSSNPCEEYDPEQCMPAMTMINLHDFGVFEMDEEDADYARFGGLTTDLNDVDDFQDINLVLQLELNLSGWLGEPSLPNEFRSYVLFNFTSLDFSSPAMGMKLSYLYDALEFELLPPQTFGSSRIFVDTDFFAELNTTTTITISYLPFTSEPDIEADGDPSAIQSTTWVTNGFDVGFGVITGNLTFVVSSFSGYDVLDSVAPSISIVYPGDLDGFATGDIFINVTANGTGSEISNVIILIDGTPNSWEASDFECTAVSEGSEVFNCSLAKSLSDGVHTIVAIAYDYGGEEPGNNGTSTEITITIDTTAPSINITSPADGERMYNNATDVYFIVDDELSSVFSCIVYVDGEVYGSNASVLLGTLTMVSNTTEYEEGSHTLVVNCTDELGNLGTSGEKTFFVDRTAPEVTEVSASGTSSSTTTGTATITATTNESATCWYSESNFTAENTTDATEMSGSGTASHSFEVAYSANGNIGPYYISCRDTAGNNMTSSYVTEEYAVSVTERRSGGGGGGGGSITYNPSVSHSWAKITPGAASIMKVASDDFGIKQITILVKNPALSINIVVEKLPGKPAQVTKTITGKVFRYLKINAKNLDDSNLDGNVKIDFKIPLSWLTENSIEAKNIALKRFANENWQDLLTTHLNSDSVYAYFRAETPGFSYFAIGEKSAEPVAVPKVEELITAPAEEEEEITGEVVAPAPEEKAPAAPAEKKPAATTTTTSQSRSGTGVQVAIVIIVVAAIGLIILSSTKKRKGLKPIKEIRG